MSRHEDRSDWLLAMIPRFLDAPMAADARSRLLSIIAAGSLAVAVYVTVSIVVFVTMNRTSPSRFETVPREHLELVLWVESDRMGFMLDALDTERLDVQRDVVKNERRQSYENRPYGLAWETLARTYEKLHAGLDALLGSTGVESLLVRSGRLAGEDFSSLDVAVLKDPEQHISDHDKHHQ